jgi:hypothetical protein
VCDPSVCDHQRFIRTSRKGNECSVCSESCRRTCWPRVNCGWGPRMPAPHSWTWLARSPVRDANWGLEARGQRVNVRKLTEMWYELRGAEIVAEGAVLTLASASWNRVFTPFLFRCSGSGTGTPGAAAPRTAGPPNAPCVGGRSGRPRPRPSAHSHRFVTFVCTVAAPH